jgi:hypothetical protein
VLGLESAIREARRQLLEPSDRSLAARRAARSPSPPDDVVRQAAQPGRPQVTVERRSELARTAGGKLKLVIADPAFRPVRTTTLLRRD